MPLGKSSNRLCRSLVSQGLAGSVSLLSEPERRISSSAAPEYRPGVGCTEMYGSRSPDLKLGGFLGSFVFGSELSFLFVE